MTRSKPPPGGAAGERPPIATIQPVRQGATASYLDIGPAESFTFGDCRCGACGFDLRVRDAWGMIQLLGRTCHVTSHHRRVPLIVWNLECATERFAVEPGSGRAPVPFELFGVDAGSLHFLTVHGPEPAGPPPLHRATCRTAPAVPQWRPRPGTRGHAVLEVLCRARDFRHPPRARDIAAELGMTVRAVQGQIDYLARRLGLGPAAGDWRPGWKLRALAEAGRRAGICA